MESDLFSSVLVVITFLSVAVLASLGLKAIRFPYTIGLMVIGLGLGAVLWLVPGFEDLRTLVLSPDIILYLVLPTLIFEASLNIDARMLLRNLGPILLLAVVGLLVSALVVALGLVGLTSVPLAAALLFGALISATDPVAVIALFKEIGAPRRLVTLIDGESLFNDATAIVLFTVLAGAVGMGSVHASDPTLLGGTISFFVVLLGGLAVGAAIGWAGSFLIQVDKGDVLFQIAVSLIMAYLSFLVADHAFHFSGVMSSLAAGLVLRYRAETAFRKHHIHTLEQIWEFFSFVANSFVFILLGLTAFNSVAHQGSLTDSLVPVLWALPLVLLARFLSIVLLVPPYNLLLKWRRMAPVPWNYQLILFWGGLRGAVPVALVLAIPETFPGRDIVLHLTFGIILFTLLVQGTTVKKLMDWLGVKPDGSPFADRPTVTRHRDYPTESLAALVLEQYCHGFEKEGFLVSEPGSGTWVLRQGSRLVTLTQRGRRLQMECEAPDMPFAKTVLSETLLQLKRSVADLDEVDVLPPEASEPGGAGTNLFAKKLRTAHVFPDLTAGTKASIVGQLIDRLPPGAVRDPELAKKDVLEREGSMSTGLGRGVATPHAKTGAVDQTVVALGVCRVGVDFGAFDQAPSHFFALILSPKEEDGPHLQLLSSVTALLSRREVQEGLRNATTAEEAFAAIRTATPGAARG